MDGSRAMLGHRTRGLGRRADIEEECKIVELLKTYGNNIDLCKGGRIPRW